MVRRTGQIDGGIWAKGCGTSRHWTRATGQGESRQDPRHQGPRDKGRRDRSRETSGDWRVDEARVDETRVDEARVDEARVDERRYRCGIARRVLHDESCTVEQAHGSTPVAHAPGYAGDYSEGSQGPFDRQRQRAKFWGIACTSTELYSRIPIDARFT